MLCCNGCAGVNLSNGGNSTELPADEAEIQVVGGGPSPAAPAPTPAPAPAPATPVEPPEPLEPAATPDATPAPVAPPPLAALETSPFTPLQLRGVRGGELAYDIDGSVDDVVAMLLDQNGAEGHRAWAQRYREVSREGERVVGEWHFRGKMGINPVVHIEFTTEREGDGARVRYKVVKRAMGIKSFFGDYRVEPVSGVPSRSRLTARVFIDSGMPFVNASHQDIENGLREDAKLMREWMGQRISARGSNSR